MIRWSEDRERGGGCEVSLEKVRIDCSPLTGQLRLARVGKDASFALETRECGAELKGALIDHMMFDAPNGTEETGVRNGISYTICVTPTKEPAHD